MRKQHLNRVFLALAVCGTPSARSHAQEGPPPAPAESLLKDLRAENVDVRRASAAKLRMSGADVQRAALPVLIDLLMKEKDGQVRLAVLDTVTALKQDAAPAIPALVHTLRTNYGGQGREESHQDYRSALALAAIGKSAVESLRDLLKERKESVRAEVVMALGRIGPDAESAVPDLIPLLGDKNERIRQEASRTLGRIGKAAVAPLVAAAAQPDVNVRAQAVESLGQFPAPNEQVQRILLDSMHDAAPAVRAAAVGALARFAMPDETVLPVLKENLRHEDEQVRLAVVNVLVARRALLPPMADELESLLTAKDDGVSRHAAFLLSKLGSDTAPRLVRSLPKEGSRVEQIAESLAQLGRPVVKLLTEASQSPEPRVRQGAVLALGQVRPLPPGVVQTLTVGLKDPDVNVKAASLTAIGYLGARAEESAPAVRAMLKDESSAIRIQAIAILSRSAPRDERLLDDLVERVNESDAQVQRRAIDAIRSLGPLGRRALSVVVAKLDSTQPEVRLAAAEFIGSHGQGAAEAVPGLSALLDDPTPEARTIAAQTLGKLGKVAQPALPKLTPLLEAKQVEVREAAVQTLGSLGLDVEVVRPHLARALRDDESRVRRAATRSIQRMGPQGAIFVPDIILLAGSKENLAAVERMLRRFERKGPDARSLPELVKQLEHDQANVRLLASKFLGLAGGSAKDAIPALERLREDPNAQVRKQAEAACERIKGHASDSPPKDKAPAQAASG